MGNGRYIFDHGDIKSGGLQGYLVSKKEVEKFNIKSLDDFRRPEVKKAFDANGDGKADLTACPPGWGCEKVIAHHMKVYGLEDAINPVKAKDGIDFTHDLVDYKGGPFIVPAEFAAAAEAAWQLNCLTAAGLNRSIPHAPSSIGSEVSSTSSCRKVLIGPSTSN